MKQLLFIRISIRFIPTHERQQLSLLQSTELSIKMRSSFASQHHYPTVLNDTKQVIITLTDAYFCIFMEKYIVLNRSLQHKLSNDIIMGLSIKRHSRKAYGVNRDKPSPTIYLILKLDIR